MGILPLIRIIFGLTFIVSGAEKILSPYQNFLYVIQGYEVIPSPVDKWVAIGFPWIEFLLGILLLAGLYTRASMIAAMFVFATFLIVVGQALIRGIDLSECGCFGELVSIPPNVVFLIDSVFFFLSGLCLIKWKETAKCGLDQIFQSKPE